MTYKLKIDIEQGSIDGRSMLVNLISGQQQINFADSIEIDIELPTNITLVFSGKNNMTDTVVDKDNKIIADMYTKITNIELDGMPFPKAYIQKWLCLETQDQKMYTSYIGFNGQMILKFEETTVFQQINWIKNKLQ